MTTKERTTLFGASLPKPSELARRNPSLHRYCCCSPSACPPARGLETPRMTSDRIRAPHSPGIIRGVPHRTMLLCARPNIGSLVASRKRQRQGRRASASPVRPMPQPELGIRRASKRKTRRQTFSLTYVHQKLDESSALSSCNAVQSWKTTMASSARSSLRASSSSYC